MLDQAFTKNQSDVFKWFENGDIGAIELRANRMKSSSLRLEQGYKFTQNQIDNFKIHIIKSKADAINEIETTFILR